MIYLTKKQILEAQDRKFKDLEVPEWGGTVRVGTMSGKERDSYERVFGDIREGTMDASIRASLCAACVVDENGVPLFTKADLQALGEKSGAALDRVFDVAVELNALGRKQEEKLKGE